MIIKYFEIWGQLLRFDQDILLSMMKGKYCHRSLQKLKKFLALPSKKIYLQNLKAKDDSVQRFQIFPNISCTVYLLYITRKYHKHYNNFLLVYMYFKKASYNIFRLNYIITRRTNDERIIHI